MEITEFLAQNKTETERGSSAVFFVDECHLLWGDVCGYVWGQKNTPIEVPIQNQTEQQTYFGRLNYKTQEFIIRSYSAGNCENTVAFITSLQSQCSEQTIAVIWD